LGHSDKLALALHVQTLLIYLNTRLVGSAVFLPTRDHQKVMVQQYQANNIDSFDQVNMDDMTLIESGLQAAEGLVQALLGAKRRLSCQTTNNAGVFAPYHCTADAQPLKRQRHSTKSVRFSNTKRVHIIDLADYTKSIQQRWYQEDDYSRIKADYLTTLVAYTKANMQIQNLDETEHCIKGLEAQISILILRMPYRNRQKKVVKSVLSLQQIQRTMQRSDTAALREMSMIVSKQDNIKALKNASTDNV
jgi:hypothetical protein